MKGRTVRNPAEWLGYLERFNDVGLGDIYFDQAYVNLYAGSTSCSEVFIYEANDELFFLPWLVRPIECPILSGPAFDFETAYGYGGPLSTSKDQAFLTEAWGAVKATCLARNIICGLLRFHPLLDTHDYCIDDASLKVVNDRDTVILTLAKSPDAIWAQYSSGTRNKIRKGEKAGVEVLVRTDSGALSIFAEMYEAHMKELSAHEDYNFGDTYFQNFRKLGEGSYRVYLAQHNGKVLGGALVLLSRRWAHYHLSSSLKEFSSLAPNNLLRHAVIMDLLNGSWEKLHFGGGRTSSGDDSLLKFKSGYSPERGVFRFGKYVTDMDVYNSVCSWWNKSYPHLQEQFASRLLKYRFR